MRKKTITYNPKNYANTKMTGVIYGKNDQKIREKKVVETKRKVKTVNYGPVDYYGKQTKTKTKTRK